MFKPQSETTSLVYLETLFELLVVAKWNHPECDDLHAAKVLALSMIRMERLNFDLMHLIVQHLDAARVLYYEVNSIYDAAWSLFIDIPIPFIAVDPPPALSDEHLRAIAAQGKADAQNDELSADEQRNAALDYLTANVTLAERNAND